MCVHKKRLKVPWTSTESTHFTCTTQKWACERQSPLHMQAPTPTQTHTHTHTHHTWQLTSTTIQCWWRERHANKATAKRPIVNSQTHINITHMHCPVQTMWGMQQSHTAENKDTPHLHTTHLCTVQCCVHEGHTKKKKRWHAHKHDSCVLSSADMHEGRSKATQPNK